jgi:pyruvate/2-oxoglutarate dehydrogenase complex dihydrolipoamide acyltransferase (E2) component
VIAVGTTLVVIGTDGAEDLKSLEPTVSAPEQEKPTAPPGRPKIPGQGETALVKESANSPVRAAPFTRRLARETHVQLESVAGTGPHGRILPQDVRNAVQGGADSDGRHLWTFSGLRKKIADHLSESVRTIPQVTVVDRFDATRLVEARLALNGEGGREYPVKVSYLAIVAKALCATVQAFPELNARWEQGSLYLYDHVHLGVAVDTEMGLVVPVLQSAERLAIPDIAWEIASLAEQARGKKLGADHLSGSTITVTGGGPLGGLFATPIINAPEVAIVGMYPIVYEVRKVNAEMEERAMMYLSLTFDHRVVDGVKASRSMAMLKQLLQDPYQLLGYLR